MTVNAIGPGFVDTEMTRGIAERTGIPFDDIAATYAKDIPVGRVGKPEDIAAVVSFFARDEASWVSRPGDLRGRWSQGLIPRDERMQVSACVRPPGIAALA